MSKNILIFSDGTGQAGGLLPDELRSNVYKLFRATRCGPDSDIDPDKQIAFYDPGLGSQTDGGRIKLRLWRRIRNRLSQATGLGITENIIDCYEALLYHWRPGDKIYLFGFSRGAYTVRCLGGVLSLCGIPTHMANDKPVLLRRDPGTLRQIATEAVKTVYRHGVGNEKRREEMKEQRKILGAYFRNKYGSNEQDEPHKGEANEVPHFIGVWDTVASVGITPPAWRMVQVAFIGALAIVSMFLAFLMLPDFLSLLFWAWFVVWLVGILAVMRLIELWLRFKVVFGVPGLPWRKSAHLTGFWMEFFDKHLNRRVWRARHALAIDEYRKDFDRVPWVDDGPVVVREKGKPWFEQYWFAGNHSDVGGSYQENESRLSDAALKWISDEAKDVGLLVCDRYLTLHGRPDGPQHDECKVGIKLFRMRFEWQMHVRKLVDNATIHSSVMERFKVGKVLHYDEMKDYRPDMLRNQDVFKIFYRDNPPSNVPGSA